MPISGSSAPRMRTMPSSSTKPPNSRARCCLRRSSSGSWAWWRLRRALSLRGAQALPAGRVQQLVLRAGTLGLGTGDLPGLAQRQAAVEHGLSGLVAVLQAPGGVEVGAGLVG